MVVWGLVGVGCWFVSQRVWVSVRVSAGGVEAVDGLAGRVGLSRSEVLRRVFAAGWPIVEQQLRALPVVSQKGVNETGERVRTPEAEK